MKPLVLILLLAVSAEAQSLADVARKERARQASVQSIRVFTTDDARGVTPPAEPAKPETPPAATEPAETRPSSSPASSAATPGASAPPAPAAVKPAMPAAPPRVDPVQKFNAEVASLRARIRDLQDQETALRLQVNQLTNQFFAPVTDQTTKDQAQARLGEVQNRLTAVQAELELTRRTLQGMEAQGPPKP